MDAACRFQPVRPAPSSRLSLREPTAALHDFGLGGFIIAAQAQTCAISIRGSRFVSSVAA